MKKCNLLMPLQPCYKHSFVINYPFKLPLHPVKQFLGYILSFYVLFCTLVPCTVFDSCEDEGQIEQTSKSDHDKDCSACSPFSVCATCHGFTLSQVVSSEAPVIVYSKLQYRSYHFSPKSEYYPSLFQPPRAV